jgi:hypothetical protein
MNLLAAVWLVLAFGIALVLVRPAVARSGLGVVHPAVPWLGLEALFFGIGSVVLALAEDRPDPAWYVGAAVLAFSIGLAASDRVAARRSSADPPNALPPDANARPDGTPSEEPGLRRFAPPALGIVALAAVAPTLLRSGIPFLTTDITGSRSELVGIPVQLVRVALPAIAVGWLFTWTRRPTETAALTVDRLRRLGPLIGIAVLIAFSIALASRYLAAELVATLGIAWLLADRRIPLRPALAIAVVGLVAFVGIGVLRAYSLADGQTGSFALERTTSRVLLVQPRTLDALIEVIPSQQPFFLGATWVRRLAPVFGVPDIPNLGYWIFPRVVAGTQDTAGYAAPGLVGEAWANLGPAGLLLFVLLGVFSERLGVLVAHRRRHLVDVMAGALAILFVARTHALGLGGLAILGALVIAWRLVAGPVTGAGGLADDLRAVVQWRPLVRGPA